MGRPSFVRQWIAAFVSISLLVAVPLESFGSPGGRSPEATPSPADVNAGGVAVVSLAPGAILAMATVPKEREPEVVASQVREHPETFALLAAGESDPAYQVAVKANIGRNFSAYFAGKLADIPFFKRPQISKSLRERVVDKVVSFVKNHESEAIGIFGAVVYASAMGGMVGTYHFSAGLDNGLKIFGGILMAYSFIATQSHTWEKILHAPGNGAVALMQKVFGELSETTVHVAKVLGVVAMSWFVGTLVNGFVLGMSGHLDNLWDPAYFGFLSNYAILDVAVLEKVKRGVLSQRGKSLYYLAQFLVGTGLEVAGIFNVPGVQAVLGIMSLSAFLYLLMGDERVEDMVVPKISMVVKRARAYERLRNRRTKQQVTYTFARGFSATRACEGLLGAAAVATVNRPKHVRAFEDLW